MGGGGRMGTTVAFLNRKGGCGKSSTCHHLAGTLAKEGRRVLLLDGDPQASLTRGLFGPETTERISEAESIAALFNADLAPLPEALIQPTEFEGISIVPGSDHLTPYNMVPPATWPAHQYGLREFVAEVRDEFDLILIDLPPYLHLSSWAALVAADGIIIPLQAEDYGAQGIKSVLEWADRARLEVNPGLRPLGVLMTMFNPRLAIHTAYEGMLREMLGELVFTASMPLSTDYKVAVASRLPISHHKPRSAAGKAMKAIAAELLERIAKQAQDDARRVA
jgi:chromosome partitioning protein